MKSKKKRLIAIGVAVVILAAAGITFWFVYGKGASTGGESERSFFVDSVANITGVGSGSGVIDRFSGVVEPQKTWNIEVSSEKTVEEVYVKEGDEVKAGDQLFIYDTREDEENLAQAEIELDRISSEIEMEKQQIAELQAEKAKAPAEDQLEYTTRIQTAENSQKKSEYEYKSQQVQIEQLKKTINSAVVTSEIDGVVKSINNTNSSDSYTSLSGEAEAFMTILATGNFRIKGTVNEQNISSIIEGQPVIVHSRVDEDQIWKGTMTAVDTENPEKNENAVYYSGDSTETSSSYPFYVELESADGLILGQHVYIEMDYGQEEKKEGLWLGEYYIVQEEDKAYVWAANSKDRLEKREITLGEYDDELLEYEILDGLTTEDYIAFPEEGIEEGMKAEKNIDQVISTTNSDEEMNLEDGEELDGMDNGEVYEDLDDGADSMVVPYGVDEDTGGVEDGMIMNEEEIGDGSAPVDAGMEE